MQTWTHPHTIDMQLLYVFLHQWISPLCSTTSFFWLKRQVGPKLFCGLKGHQTDALWLIHPHRLQISASHHENRAAAHKHWGRLERGIRPVTEECNQSDFYYVSQRATGQCGSCPTRHSGTVIVCVMHACFEFQVCMCLDECVHIPLICYTCAMCACVLLNLFEWENEPGRLFAAFVILKRTYQRLQEV